MEKKEIWIGVKEKGGKKRGRGEREEGLGEFEDKGKEKGGKKRGSEEEEGEWRGRERGEGGLGEFEE